MNESNLHILKRYVDKHRLFTPFIQVHPEKQLNIVVVIPCFFEPKILTTLSSLSSCNPTQNNIEVIVVVNSSEITDNKTITYNKKTHASINEWAKINNSDWIKFYSILIENVPKKHAGAGYARKVGMDEAIDRFLRANNDNGIICSLDADTEVAMNYFIEIEKLFANKTINGCSIYFEHDINGNEFSDEVYKRICEYETHLRYYKLALQYTNFPFFHYTIGSSFAVSAQAYCAQGGMNKKQAGEDFYFIQKIMQKGHFFALNTTAVFPSSRPSDRVPFGTGPVIKQYISEPEKEFLTYNYKAFTHLKVLFSNIELFFRITGIELDEILKSHHPAMIAFIKESGFVEAIKLINEDTNQLNSFTKRFYQWFDAFRIVKYLNFVHGNFFNKQNIHQAIQELIVSQINQNYSHTDLKKTLLFLRTLENRS